jgi:Cof subfamily protein (haloacid dehalogenase superfamily)
MQLIAIDLDGTLLNSKDNISAKNVQAIKELKRQGIEVTLATGRDYHDALAILKKAGLSTHVISSNGTSVHKIDGERLSISSISMDVARGMLKWLEQEKYYYEVTANDVTYTPIHSKAYLEKELWRMRKNCPAALDELQLELNKLMRSIATVEHYEELFTFPAAYQNILVFSPDKARLAAGAAFFKAMPELNVVSSLDHNIEMNAKSASKGAALKILADSLKLSLDNTLAMGDNYNDVSMFQTAKYSIAMGNAKDDIKAACSFVTLKNDEDGVAYALDNIVAALIKSKLAV